MFFFLAKFPAVLLHDFLIRVFFFFYYSVFLPIPPIFDVYLNDDNDMMNFSPFISSYYEIEEVSEIVREKNMNEHKVFGSILNTTCVALNGVSLMIGNKRHGEENREESPI